MLVFVLNGLSHSQVVTHTSKRLLHTQRDHPGRIFHAMLRSCHSLACTAVASQSHSPQQRRYIDRLTCSCVLGTLSLCVFVQYFKIAVDSVDEFPDAVNHSAASPLFVDPKAH